MAVIITNMDMPKCCGDCPLLKSGYGHCELGIKIAFLSEKASDCPLRSADKMIEEIEQIVAEEKINDPKWALGLKYSLHIIHKYCDKGAER